MTVAYVFPLIHRLDDEEPSCLEWWHTFISSQHLLCLGGCSFMSSAFMLFADQSYIGPRDDSCFLKRRQGSSVFRPDQRQKLASVRFWTRKRHNVSSSQWKSTLRGRFGIKCLSSRVEWFILKLNPCFEDVVSFVSILRFYETASIIPLKTWRKEKKQSRWRENT